MSGRCAWLNGARVGALGMQPESFLGVAAIFVILCVAYIGIGRAVQSWLWAGQYRMLSKVRPAAKNTGISAGSGQAGLSISRGYLRLCCLLATDPSLQALLISASSGCYAVVTLAVLLPRQARTSSALLVQECAMCPQPGR